MRLDENDEDDEYEDKSEPAELYLHQNTVFIIIEPATFIRMKSPFNAIEPFFIAEILQKVLLKRAFAMKMDILFLKVRCMQKETTLKKLKKL